MSKHVAVLMGGWSNERPVSLSSGAGCAAALRNAGYRVTKVDVGRDVADVLRQLKPDVAFNALHGPFGESGMIQGVLELLEIPYTHSGVMASALAMNKHQAKIAFKAAGIPVTDHVIVTRAEAARDHVMAPPYVIKPIADGSSFGVFIVKAETSHPPQELLREDWNNGEEVMVERFIPGRELTCAVMGNVALGVTEIVTNLSFYNYEAKYAAGGSVHILPADLKPKIYDKVQKLALAAHAALGCRGVTRSDFRYNEAAGEDGELVCLEINTQPGMTATSLVPEQALHAGHSYEDLVSWMVEDASCNR
ncbi:MULTISPECIES: D-alanine--D-alanine ligase [unclassified Devosia]|uniref:D-alanine--D-alanine ligase n=1 Tax=unclassified Devosia TaxID=196773 RepID=UPI00145E4601|nr:MULTISPECIES: D-alanine--D-alanine ligase [unclassified Devosia]MBJ6986615.1 D-alanine--D-alanine ligase [Devosia sp. MC521]QMW61654.1 D-alanine--D-alanine ligase [Devosia sp. MC521]